MELEIHTSTHKCIYCNQEETEVINNKYSKLVCISCSISDMVNYYIRRTTDIQLETNSYIAITTIQ